MKWLRERVICSSSSMGFAAFVRQNMRVHAILVTEKPIKHTNKQKQLSKQTNTNHFIYLHFPFDKNQINRRLSIRTIPVPKS